MFRPLATLAAVVFGTALLPAAPPVPTHKDLPAALKEAKALRVPALVVLTKPKTALPAIDDPRIARAARGFVCVSVPLTPALDKQYDLGGDPHALVLDADGAAEKFGPDAAAELLVASVKRHATDARAELLKGLTPESDAKGKKAAMSALVRLGPPAENLVPLLTDSDAGVKEAARKALAALSPDATATALLDALKSDDAALRSAAHPLAVAATGYKAAPLKLWQTGTAEERAAAWEKWHDAAESQSPSLNRAVLAYCEFSLGAQVANGECSSLAVEALKESGAKPMVHSGATYVWGRPLKAGEAVLPGDVVQYEGVKFANGAAPHHTSVIRKVLAPGRFEILEQNVNGVKKVQPGKLDLTAVKEGTIVIHRPLPK